MIDETGSGMSILWARMVCLLGSRGAGENYPARKSVSIYNRARAQSDTTAMSVRKLLDLTGKIALVTGGSRGLGLQIAEALGEMGAKVALTARKQDELDQAVAHLESRLGIGAVALECDMSNAAAIAPMVERAIAALGPIDIL